MVISSAASMPGEWSFWSWLLLAVLVVGIPVWYLTGMKRFRAQGTGGASLSAGQVSAFFVWLGLAAVAFLLPMDVLGMNYVFTIHMAQHLLLSLAAPPLCIIGLPVGFFRALFSYPWGKRTLHWLTRPFVASALFNDNIWLWHAPALIFLMMAQPGLHLLASDQQLGGLLMWVGGGLFLYVVVTSIFFLQWMLQQERLEQAGEAASDS